jgi:hypothetical protein
MAGNRPRHPKKEVEGAVQYAEGKGWRVEMAKGHAWAHLLCPSATRDGCWICVWSTPRSPGNHARSIRRLIDKCDCMLNKGGEREES